MERRWMILIASLVINLCIGSGYAWSVFMAPLMKLFGWTAAATALAFTVSNSVGPVTMIFGGRLQDKFGPKWVIFAGAFFFGGGVLGAGYTDSLSWLYMTYGVLMGLGMGTIYGCTIANTVKWFPDKRGLVAGLATAGYGFGSVVAAPLAQSFIESYGVLTCFKILGVAYLILIALFSQFITPPPAGYKPAGWNPPAPAAGSALTGVDKTWSQMLADPMFYVLLIMLMCGAFSGLMIISQAAPIALGVIKVAPAAAALAVSYLALSNTFGRVFWGWVSDKIGRFSAIIIMYIIAGVATFGLTGAGEGAYSMYVLGIMAVGLCFGGIMGIFPALTADTFGPKNNGVNYGFMFCGFALAGFFGPKLAAETRAAHNGDPTQAFIIAAVCSIVGIILTLFVSYKKKQQAKIAAGQ